MPYRDMRLSGKNQRNFPSIQYIAGQNSLKRRFAPSVLALACRTENAHNQPDFFA
jgi:hypothetical protein